ncbi:MAG: L,D-transpeptidase, partial [Bacteroidetes bacterium]|nr:L,D-transpeptidase [Bacteroidota bacterium]
VGIGIHGTHLPNVIGSRASHGCIRMKNEDLLSLRATIRPGVPVIIVPGEKDLKQNRQKVSHEETKKPKPKREKSKPSKKQSLQKARRNPN